MPKILVIAEKPAMGRDIAEALSVMTGKSIQRAGLAQIVGQYTVIGAQGHLFSLCEPEHYGEQFKYWKIAPLPVLPDQFELEPNFVKVRGEVVNNDLTKSIRNRLSEIKDLIKDADEVIHCGDPDREGQLIIDDVIRQYKFKGPVKRLWLHAQTPDGIRDALGKMRSNDEYKLLGLAALARRESDWAIGINATRAYSVLWKECGNQGVLNIGRVVAPVIGLLVNRENEIRNFKPTDHYTLKATITLAGQAPYQANWIKPTGEGPPEFDPTGKLIVDKKYVQSIQAKCDGAPATVKEAEKTPKKEGPPLLFSLTELQKMAAKMGYAPDHVLAAAQALYEKHKLTSYPRSDCQYAPESQHALAGKVIASILQNFGAAWNVPAGHSERRKSKAWDDKKLAEHYAIIPLPTNMSLSALSKTELDVYKLICRQYLAQFYADHEYMASSITVQVASEQFKATGKAPTVEGWKVLYGGVKASEEDQENLPLCKAGDKGIAKPVELVAKKTEAPKRFTAITLLEAMQKIYLFVTDPKVKAALKEVEGLGTSATRANIISKVVASGFAVEEKAGKVIAYAPTPKAHNYIASIPKSLATPDLTAWFEGKLEEISKGDLSYERYRAMLAKLVAKALEPAKDGSAKQLIVKVDAPPAAPAKKTARAAAGKTTRARAKSPSNKKTKSDADFF